MDTPLKCKIRQAAPVIVENVQKTSANLFSGFFLFDNPKLIFILLFVILLGLLLCIAQSSHLTSERINNNASQEESVNETKTLITESLSLKKEKKKKKKTDSSDAKHDQNDENDEEESPQHVEEISLATKILDPIIEINENQNEEPDIPAPINTTENFQQKEQSYTDIQSSVDQDKQHEIRIDKLGIVDVNDNVEEVFENEIEIQETINQADVNTIGASSNENNSQIQEPLTANENINQAKSTNKESLARDDEIDVANQESQVSTNLQQRESITETIDVTNKIEIQSDNINMSKHLELELTNLNTDETKIEAQNSVISEESTNNEDEIEIKRLIDTSIDNQIKVVEEVKQTEDDSVYDKKTKVNDQLTADICNLIDSFNFANPSGSLEMNATAIEPALIPKTEEEECIISKNDENFPEDLKLPENLSSLVAACDSLNFENTSSSFEMSAVAIESTEIPKTEEEECIISKNDENFPEDLKLSEILSSLAASRDEPSFSQSTDTKSINEITSQLSINDLNDQIREDSLDDASYHDNFKSDSIDRPKSIEEEQQHMIKSEVNIQYRPSNVMQQISIGDNRMRFMQTSESVEEKPRSQIHEMKLLNDDEIELPEISNSIQIQTDKKLNLEVSSISNRDQDNSVADTLDSIVSNASSTERSMSQFDMLESNEFSDIQGSENGFEFVDSQIHNGEESIEELKLSPRKLSDDSKIETTLSNISEAIESSTGENLISKDVDQQEASNKSNIIDDNNVNKLQDKDDISDRLTDQSSVNSLLSLYQVKHVNAIADNFKSLREIAAAVRDAGLEKSQLIFGIDFTISNLENGQKTFHGRSLHYHEKDLKNPYQKVIEILGKTLEHFDLDGKIPAFGFGDSKTKDRKVFSFTESGYCNGFSQVLECYNRIVENVELSGPTNFAPLIKEAIKIVESTKQYHILVIVADGQVTNERQTREAIVEASKHALSIVMVGVGDGPWDTMEEFDDSLPKRQFDNFQFVNYHEVTSNSKNPDEVFALNALMEIPDQYKTIKELNLLNFDK